MSNSHLISIIVPVYNTEKYLSQCLESLVNQTYSTIEIIVVNDGSTDNSIEIIRSFAKNDNRIIIEEQENKGVSEARNLGITKVTGDFVLFVDSDDWIDLNTCELAINAISINNSDIVLFSYTRDFGNGTKKIRKILPDEKQFNKEESLELRRRLYGLYDNELSDPSQADTLGTVFSKLYKSKIIKKYKLDFIDINQIGSAEDILFNISYFKYITSAYYLNISAYNLRKYNETSITTKYRSQLAEQWKKLFEIMLTTIENENLNDTFKLALNNRIALSIFGLGLNILSSEYSTKNKISELKKILTSSEYITAYSQLKFKYFPIHWKVFFFLAKNQNATTLYIFLNIIRKIVKR